jgi:hypothetical protein
LYVLIPWLFPLQAGISAIRRLRKTDNNRIARATGATICHRVEEVRRHANVGRSDCKLTRVAWPALENLSDGLPQWLYFTCKFLGQDCRRTMTGTATGFSLLPCFMSLADASIAHCITAVFYAPPHTVVRLVLHQLELLSLLLLLLFTADPRVGHWHACWAV